MKTLIVTDSTYGNTEAIAQAIAEATGGELRRVADARPDDLREVDLLFVGSPTQGGRATAPIQEFVKQLPPNGLAGIGVAAFDTRLDPAEQNFGLRVLMRVISFAAPRIARALQAKGGRLVAAAEGFIVLEKEGPLKPGERERAAEWARRIQEQPG